MIRSDPIQVEQENGVWWFVDPRIGMFVSKGINHVEPDLMTAPYNLEQTLERYGQDFIDETGSFDPQSNAVAAWIEQVEADLRKWEFNTFGYHTWVPYEHVSDDMYYLAQIEGAPIRRYRRPTKQPGKEYVTTDPRPDIFDPQFSEGMRALAAEICSDNAHRENLLGYVFSDIPRWEIDTNDENPIRLHPWVRELTELDFDAPGKEVWIECLQSNYGSPEAAGRAYGVRAAEWNELRKRTEWIPDDPAIARKDSERMMARIAERWYSVHVSSIKTHDPDRLIFGDKLAGGVGVPDYLMPILREYIDVVCIQWYGWFENQKQELTRIHAQTRCPILLGDSAFSTVRPQQDQAKGVHVDSPDAVGDAYYDYLKSAMQTPFIVGWHHCGYVEGWNGIETEGHWVADRQCGLKDPFENEHQAVVKKVRAANKQAQEWHKTAGESRVETE